MKKRMTLCIFLMLIIVNAGALRAAEDPRPQHARGDLKSPSSQATVPDGTSQALSQVQTYEQLVAAIRKAHAASQTRVEQAVQQEKVRECWETGKLIDEHVLQHKERADYGKQVILRLSQDLSISDTELRYMLQFARTYPIYRTSDELTWGHYESLLALNDTREREEVEALASKEKWPLQKMRDEVKKRKAAKNETPAPVQETPLTAQPGKPGTYKIVKAVLGPETGKAVIDLGFSNYYRTSRDLRFKEGAIIEVLPAFPEGASAPSDLIKLSKRTSGDLYTYRAWVTEVLDGDTLKAVIDLGFGVRSVQTIRLRAIDCPEMNTAEGKAAKKFVENALQGLEFITIKTIKSDKYDRYLGDVFYSDKAGKQEYLNNRLLEAGHAVRVRE